MSGHDAVAGYTDVHAAAEALHAWDLANARQRALGMAVLTGAALWVTMMFPALAWYAVAVAGVTGCISAYSLHFALTATEKRVREQAEWMQAVGVCTPYRAEMPITQRYMEPQVEVVQLQAEDQQVDRFSLIFAELAEEREEVNRVKVGR